MTPKQPDKISIPVCPPGVGGTSAILFSAATGGIILYYQSANINESLGGLSHSDILEREKLSWNGDYIYVNSTQEGADTFSHQNKNNSNGYLKSGERKRFCLSRLQSWSHDPHTLLRLAQSDQHSVRLLGVQALAAQKHWFDAQYLAVAQACDKRTLVGLARSSGVDRRFFLAPPPLPPEVELEEDELRRLLAVMPTTGIDKCTNYFTSQALAEGKIPPEERESIWSFDGNGLMRLVPTVTESTSSRVISFCLHALFSHSKVSSHCPEIVQNDGLQVLQRIYLNRGHCNIKVCRNIARIISNIALHDEMHSNILNAGWVTILSEWLTSSDLALSLLAGKALANLDQDFGGGKYKDGVHLYYPQHRFREPLYADVVFVHGILGGPFRTWRQRDPDPPSPKKKQKAAAPISISPDSIGMPPQNVPHQEGMPHQAGPHQERLPLKGVPQQQADRVDMMGLSEGQSHPENGLENDEKDEDPRTQCWPKDWLSKDCPHMRLLTLEYETHLSEWAPKCPFGSEKRSLSVRSEETLRKLKEAGLGKRPIIWVGHSMGGLIIKNMLVSARYNPAYKEIVEKSRGIVFYSVPHRGSPVVTRSAQTKYLLYPSVEVEELVQDSEMLLTLHKSFTDLMFDTGIPLLSFGEGKKSDLPFNFKLMIVPPESSNPGFGEYHLMTDLNHLNICKPRSKDSRLYQMTLHFICDCIPQNQVDNIIRTNIMPEGHIFSEFMN